jgi:hypothetical protein
MQVRVCAPHCATHMHRSWRAHQTSALQATSVACTSTLRTCELLFSSVEAPVAVAVQCPAAACVTHTLAGVHVGPCNTHPDAIRTERIQDDMELVHTKVVIQNCASHGRRRRAAGLGRGQAVAGQLDIRAASDSVPLHVRECARRAIQRQSV